MKMKYDIIIVGGGHAGCEAAAAASRMGSKTLLITMNLQTIGQMSCNPAVGGVAKGQIVREIDALGGLMGQVADKTAIQFRMLNRSKGPAMWSPRVQSDRMRFAEEWRLRLEAIPNLDFFQDMVTDLKTYNGKVVGVTTGIGVSFDAEALILTNGTFLNGLIHIGDKQFGGGRAGERGSVGITECLNQFGFESGRMKTGTPPRVDARSLDYSKMEEQKGDDLTSVFSFNNNTSVLAQRSCHITYTNPAVHNILAEALDRSPMYNGQIESKGPRYCPSIEDKINRFADKDRHQIFVEPEGAETIEVYVNGFSTSMPTEVQMEAIQLISGFANAKIFRPGYAIEYDFFQPTQLHHTLETKLVEGLYFAGQINGTTGYEEAACQGLMAAINAHKKINDEGSFVLGREEAYIGVLIDDLVSKGTEEPYRMFTSRAEYRILLRQDNADERLRRKGFELGLVSENEMMLFDSKQSLIDSTLFWLQNTSAEKEQLNEVLTKVSSKEVAQKNKIGSIIGRPEVGVNDLLSINSFANFVIDNKVNLEVLEQVEIRSKYAGYIDKERENAQKLIDLESLIIPDKLDFKVIDSLSYEAREKLMLQRPATIAQAKRISGVSPSDISVLLVYMGR